MFIFAMHYQVDAKWQQKICQIAVEQRQWYVQMWHYHFELITGFHAIIKWTLQLHYAKSHISISNAKMNTSLPIGKLKLTMKLTTQQIQLDPIRKLSVIKWCGFQINMQFICCLCSCFHARFTIYKFISICNWFVSKILWFVRDIIFMIW